MIGRCKIVILISVLMGLPLWEVLADQVSTLERRRSLLESHRRRLETLLSAQVRRISRLKQQQAGVRRDFQLRRALRENRELASRLTKLQKRVRELNQHLLQVIDSAIARAKTKKGKDQLLKYRQKIARRFITRATRIVTSEKASPLDSPEDLEEKADLLKDSEEKVRRQLKRIKQQLSRLRRRSKLQRHSRSVDDSPFIESSLRRIVRSQRSEKLDSYSPKNQTNKEAVDTNNRTPAPAGDDNLDNAGEGSDSSNSVGGDNYTEKPPLTSDSTAKPFPSSGLLTGNKGRMTTIPGVIVRGVLDPSILVELRRANKSGSLRARLKALEKAKKKLEQMAKALNMQSLKLRQRAKTRK
jgi:hypothetical protein